MFLFGQLERYIGARGHHLTAEIGKPDCRVFASAHGYAACFNESLSVGRDVILRELFQQTVGRQLVEVMFYHLS